LDIQKYINSGVLEEYCLGLLDEADEAFLSQLVMLYPEIKEALTATELIIERLARANAKQPSAILRQKVLTSLGFPDELLDLDNLPAIDGTTEYEAWLSALDHLIPARPEEDFIVNVIRNDERYQQMLIVTKNDVPEEEHSEFLESFFILKGQCECTVDNELFKLSPGDFLEIPLHTKHDIKIVSPHVVGILQYRFV
jgi:mannose-6-phosphate isomerase-like protein (cupin superfamily)